VRLCALRGARADGKITSTLPAVGPRSNFTYNEAGSPTSTSTTYHVDGEPVTLWQFTTYDAEGRVTGTSQRITEAGVTRTLWGESTEYTSTGQVRRETDRFGHVTEYTYDLRGQTIQIRSQSEDENGVTQWLVSRTVYDSQGRAVVQTGQFIEGAAVTSGSRTVYDSLGRVVRTEQLEDIMVALVGAAPDLEAVLAVPGRVVSSTGTEFDAAGRVAVTTDRYGTETRYAYDLAGRTIETRTQSLDENGVLRWLVSRTVYDKAGRVTDTSDRYIEGVTPAGEVFGNRTVYDAVGRAVRTQRLQGLAIDLGAQNSAVTSAGEVVWQTETVYNALGQMVRSIGRHAPGESGPQTDYEYDSAGRQVATIGPAVLDESTGELVRHRTESEFDANGRLALARTNIRVVVDAAGNVLSVDRTEARETSYEFDAQGNTVRTTFADGSYTASTFDDFGRLLTESVQAAADDPSPLFRTFEYDDSGRLVAVVLPAVEHPDTGLMVQPRWEYGYDAQGNHVSIRDNVVQVSVGVGLYDHDGTPGDDTRLTTFTYDADGRQLSRTLPEGQTEEHRYNDLGQLVLDVSFEGVVTEYVYATEPGAGGRLVAKRFFDDLAAYADGSGVPAELVAYSYDTFGRQVEVVQDRDGDLATTADQRVTTNTFDALGQLVTVATPEGTLHYEYSPVTGESVRTWAGDDPAAPILDTRYVFDALGRLDAVEVHARAGEALSSPELTDYAYTLEGNPDWTRLPNGVFTDYVYDQLGRLDLMRQTDSAGTLLAEYDYDLLPDGRRAGVSEIDPTGATTRIDWVYDNLGRLVREVFDSSDDSLDFTDEYSFDLVSNRLEKLHDQGSDGTIDEAVAYTYDKNDRLLTETLDAPGAADDRFTVYEYGEGNSGTQETRKTVHAGLDASGPVTSDTRYRYNRQGRLWIAEIDSDGDGTVDTATGYEYNDAGIRVSQSVNGEKTLYLVDHQNPTGYAQVVAEIAAATQEVLRTYTLGLDVIDQATITAAAQAVVNYLLYDGHGSTRGLVDALGQPLSERS
jgi:YD repeat-containing protein